MTPSAIKRLTVPAIVPRALATIRHSSEPLTYAEIAAQLSLSYLHVAHALANVVLPEGIVRFKVGKQLLFARRAVAKPVLKKLGRESEI